MFQQFFIFIFCNLQINRIYRTPENYGGQIYAPKRGVCSLAGPQRDHQYPTYRCSTAHHQVLLGEGRNGIDELGRLKVFSVNGSEFFLVNDIK